MFQYISFRAAASIITSLFIMLVLGKPFIRWMQNRLGMMDEVRTELGLEGAERKAKTPTMGGVLILAAIVIPTLLFAKLDNIYVLIMLGTTVWMGLVGFLDDYLKKTRGKAGLPGKYKVMGQVLLGLAVGLLICFHPDITNPLKTTIPFVKNNEFDYTWLVSWMGEWAVDYAWIIYVVVIVFVITAVSNASNLTDGIDGIATGVAAVNGGALALLAWVSGNVIMSSYLNIMYLPSIGELAIFSTAFYSVDTMYHSKPYLLPEAVLLLDYIAHRFDQLMDEHYPQIGRHKVIVTSALRTEQSEQRLRRVNRNATDTSCHIYGTTFDLSAQRYEHIASGRDTVVDACKQMLALALYELRYEGLCYVKYERGSCFHITLRTTQYEGDAASELRSYVNPGSPDYLLTKAPPRPAPSARPATNTSKPAISSRRKDKSHRKDRQKRSQESAPATRQPAAQSGHTLTERERMSMENYERRGY